MLWVPVLQEVGVSIRFVLPVLLFLSLVLCIFVIMLKAEILTSQEREGGTEAPCVGRTVARKVSMLVICGILIKRNRYFAFFVFCCVFMVF